MCVGVGGTGKEQLGKFQYKAYKLGPDFKTTELELYSTGKQGLWMPERARIM